MFTTCPVCDEGIIYDGFFEHGVPTLWYCKCGRIFRDGQRRNLELSEVPKSEVNLTADFPEMPSVPERGQFINRSRWNKRHNLTSEVVG